MEKTISISDILANAVKSVLVLGETSAIPEETIRERAYLLWEEAGRPECDGVEFWVRAEQELNS